MLEEPSNPAQNQQKASDNRYAARMTAAAGMSALEETPATARCQQQQGPLQLQEHLQQQGFQTTTVVASKIEDSNTKSDNANNNWYA